MPSPWHLHGPVLAVLQGPAPIPGAAVGVRRRQQQRRQHRGVVLARRDEEHRLAVAAPGVDVHGIGPGRCEE